MWRKIEVIAVFLVTAALTAGINPGLCAPYRESFFDAQNYISWAYAAGTGQLPYRDITFLYGFWPYLAGQTYLGWLLNRLIAPLLFTGLFILFKRLVKPTNLAYGYLAVMVLGIGWTGDWGSWPRYGWSLVYVMALALTWKHFGWFGVIAGMLAFLYTDQGILVATVTGGMLALNQKWTALAKFGIGFVVGAIPLLYFGNLADYLVALKEMQAYAHKAIAPYLNVLPNLIGFGELWVAATVLSYRRFWVKKTGTTDRMLLAVTLLMVLLEQKNLMRIVDRSIFMVVLVGGILLFELWRQEIVEPRLSGWEQLSYLAVVGVFFLGYTNFVRLGNNLPKPDFLTLIPQVSDIKAYDTCRQAALSPKNLPLNPEARQVEAYLYNQPEVPKVFGFPNDAMWYVVFNQPLPRYNNGYDASSVTAQGKQIEYLEKNPVNWVIYNLEDKQIDGVPYLVRDRVLAKYILTHYRPVKLITPYLLLKRTEEKYDLFTDRQLTPNIKAVVEGWKTMDLGYLPNLKTGELKVGPIGAGQAVTIKNLDGTVATISAHTCQKDCSIDLSLLPVFYLPRQISLVAIK